MKLKILIMAAGLVVFVSCGPSYRVADQSNPEGNGNVPAAIQSSFNSQYPTATDVMWTPYDANNLPIDWTLTGWNDVGDGAYVSTFTLDDNQYYSWYDASGNWIGSTYAIRDYSTLPSPVSTTISGKFPGYTITSVNSELQKDKMNYEITLKNADGKAKVVIDSNGNIVKQKMVTK
ncbi:MAG TPA: PepSY-like domain-containing protein [Chitinophagaceae bacterium]